MGSDTSSIRSLPAYTPFVFMGTKACSARSVQMDCVDPGGVKVLSFADAVLYKCELLATFVYKRARLFRLHIAM